MPREADVIRTGSGMSHAAFCGFVSEGRRPSEYAMAREDGPLAAGLGGATA